MIPILYETMVEGTVPSTFGLGHLSSALRCEVSEERNGKYELVLEYTSEGIHAEDIQVNRFIMAKPNFTDDPQIFRIYKVGKVMNGKFTVYAQHISYDLSGKVISAGTAGSCTAACLLLQASAGNFTISTNKNVSADFTIKEPSSVRSWFGGKQGSLLDVYGTAEWYYDNYDCVLKLNRGQDRGVELRYGKNLTDLSQEIDMSNLCTGVIPYYIDDETNTKVVGAKVSTGLVLDVDRDQAVDFSSDVDPESSTPIATQLATLASNYIANNIFTRVFSSITLDFVQMGELKDRVDLCDTVHIFFEPLGISVALKCIATVWDVLQERYIQTTFGDSRNSIADTIVNQQQEVKDVVSNIITAIDRATDLISGNLGGYVINGHDSNGDGYPDENLIMDTNDIKTATAVWRWNLGGLGFSPNGYAGPYDAVALDMQGRINASAIATGTLNANLIKAGVISDVAGNSTIDMTNGQANLFQLIARRDLTIKNTNGDDRGCISQIDNGNGIVLRFYDSTGTNYVVRLEQDGDRGYLYLCNGNGDVKVRLEADEDNGQTFGVIKLYNDNGDKTVELDGKSGRIKGTGAFDKVYDSSVQRPMSSAGDWWTFTTDFQGLFVVGKVVSTGSRTTTIIPIEMLNSTPTRFYLSDESNYLSFDCSITGDLAKVEIAAKSSTGFIEKVYGMF